MTTATKQFLVSRWKQRYEDTVTRQTLKLALNDTFAAAWPECYRKPAEGKEGWVTIGGSASGGKKHAGGTPVQLGERGKIIKGPSGLEGKDLDSISKAGDDRSDRSKVYDRLNRGHSAEFDGKNAKIGPHPNGPGWVAQITHPDGRIESIGSPKGSRRDAQDAAATALAGEEPQTTKTPPAAPQESGSDAQTQTGPKPDETGPKPDETGPKPEKQNETTHKNPPIPSPGPESFGGIEGVGVTSHPDGRKTGMTFLKASDIASDPGRFQYKIDDITDENAGVTSKLKDSSHFNPMYGGQMLVWHDPNDDTTYVINGHHRLELMNRSSYQGPIPTYFIEAMDEQEARSAGALANIAGNNGTAIDAAAFFKESGKTVDDIRATGISIKGRVADEGMALSKLSDSAFRHLKSKMLGEKHALMVARNIEDHSAQDRIVNTILTAQRNGRNLKDGQILEMAERAGTAVMGKRTRKDANQQLIGGWDEDDVEALDLEQAIVIHGVKKAIGADIRAFKSTGVKGRQGILEQAGNVINAEENIKRKSAAAAMLDTFTRETRYRSDLNDKVNEFAVRLAKEPKSESKIIEEAEGFFRSSMAAPEGRPVGADNEGSGQASADSEGGWLGRRSESERVETDDVLGSSRIPDPRNKSMFALASEFDKRMRYGKSTLNYESQMSFGWSEEDHPRSGDGKFSESSSTAVKEPPKQVEKPKTESSQPEKTSPKPSASTTPSFSLVKEKRRLYFDGKTYHVKEDIKDIGGRWDRDSKRWWVGSTKKTAAESLIRRLNSEKEKRTEYVTKTKTSGSSVDIPYRAETIREKAKSLGAIWDKPNKQWILPDSESAAKIESLVKEYVGGHKKTQGNKREASDKQKSYLRKLVNRMGPHDWFDLLDNGFEPGLSDESISEISASEASGWISELRDCLPGGSHYAAGENEDNDMINESRDMDDAIQFSAEFEEKERRKALFSRSAHADYRMMEHELLRRGVLKYRRDKQGRYESHVREFDAPCFGDSCVTSHEKHTLDYASPWDENKHPRADDGKFGQGGGGAEPEQPQSAPTSPPWPVQPSEQKQPQATPPQQSEHQQQPFKADMTEINRQYPPANPNGIDTQAKYKVGDQYTPERQRLHEGILGNMMAGVTPSQNPTVYMMGGGPASGKSTMIRGGFVTLPENSVHVDSDDIKGQIPEYKAMVQAKDAIAASYAHEESSELSKMAIASSTANGFDAVMDGTGDSGIEKLRKKVQGWRANGHKVVANYATVPTETAMGWATERSKKTGRMVPKSVIEGTHRTVSQILPQAITEGLFDELNLFDNSTGQSVLVVSAQGTKMQVHDQGLWESFLAKGQ